VTGLDQRLERWIVHHRAEPFDTIFVGLSHIGSYGIVWLTLALLAVLLERRLVILPLVLLAYVLSSATADALKVAVARARPGDDTLLPLPTSHSFPSGHAATSFACAATLARFVPTRASVVVLYLLAVAISYSRMYVGVHYPLDVLAGAIIGLAVATALRLLPVTPRRSPRAPRAG